MSYTAAFRISAFVTVVTVVACGPGVVDNTNSDAAPERDLPAAEDGEEEDDFHCGELGVSCVGGLGLGECIDGECTPNPGQECWSSAVVPTCDAYCEALDETCAYLGCEGATAYGWMGSQQEANYYCGDWQTAVPMTVTCDQPLEGLITTMFCCCT